MGFFSKNEPRYYTIKNRELKCPICGNDKFHTRSAQLNTSFATFFNFDWANRSATCLVCSDCTHIQWFLDAVVTEK
ncbi:MAG: DNA-binding protein [Deltaproteobacteria bacterium]